MEEMRIRREKVALPGKVDEGVFYAMTQASSVPPVFSIPGSFDEYVQKVPLREFQAGNQACNQTGYAPESYCVKCAFCVTSMGPLAAFLGPVESCPDDCIFTNELQWAHKKCWEFEQARRKIQPKHSNETVERRR